MYNLVGGNLKEFKNLGMIHGFNIEHPKNNNSDIIKINEITFKENDVIEDIIYIKFYDFLALKNKKSTRKNDVKSLNKKSRKR
tara:strand:+ start:2040 stop:2288 length:249 start_codon:yes stop_codon:yes gene_type:complete